MLPLAAGICRQYFSVSHALPGWGSAHLGPQLLAVEGMTAEPPESQGEGSAILFVLQRRKLGLGSTLLVHHDGR